MSLYDGLDLDAKAGPIRGASEDLSGWGSSLKLLETQKQLQAKKYVLQNVKRKSEGTVLAPVIDLKGRKGEVPGELRFNQITGKLESITNIATFGGAEASFLGVKDEYDPLRPNDYESYTKLRREDKTRDRDDNRRNRHSDERENRRGDRRRGDDEDDDEDYARRRDRDRDRERERDRERDREKDRDRDRDRDDDEGEFERRRRRRAEEDEEEDRSRRAPRASGAAIAPPPSLMDLEIPTPDFLLQKQAAQQGGENKQEPSGPAPGTKFGMGGSVASKIMAKMGYREGQGLGKSEQGMSIALQVEKTSKRGGKIIHEKDLAKMQEPVPVAVQSQAPKPEISNANLLRNPSKVIVLRNMVGPGEVDEELERETAEECEKYGKVYKCLIFEIPSAPDDEAVRIFLEFERLESAIKAVVDLNGRYFGGRIVKGSFYNLDKFRRFDLGDPVE